MFNIPTPPGNDLPFEYIFQGCLMFGFHIVHVVSSEIIGSRNFFTDGKGIHFTVRR